MYTFLKALSVKLLFINLLPLRRLHQSIGVSGSEPHNLSEGALYCPEYSNVACTTAHYITLL
jgi:hypothetical protein